MHRKEKYDICHKLGVEAKLLWIKAPTELSKERAVHDSRQHLWPKNEAPAAMFDRLVNVFEPPRDDEPYIELDGTKIQPEYIKQTLQL
jgi:hypothetical protein